VKEIKREIRERTSDSIRLMYPQTTNSEKGKKEKLRDREKVVGNIGRRRK